MSNHYSFNFPLFDGLPAAIILFAIVGGGSTFATIRRNWQRARQADPEAIEMETTTAVQGQTTVEATGTIGGNGIVETAGAADVSGTLEVVGEVEGSVTLDVGDDGGASD